MQPQLKNYQGKMTEWTWSGSKLTKAMTCWYQLFRDHLIHQAVPGQNNAFAIGSGVHDALEQISIDYAENALLIDMTFDDKGNDVPFCHNTEKYAAIARNSTLDSKDLEKRKLKDGEIPPEEQAASIVRKYIDYCLDESNGVYFLKPMRRREPVNRKINGQWKKHNWWTEFWGDIFLEDKFFGGNIQIKIKGDILTENLSVVDWKTASKPYTIKEIENPLAGKGLQLTTYGVWSVQNTEQYGNNGWMTLVKENLSNHQKFKVQPISYQMTPEIVEGFNQLVNQINREFILQLIEYQKTKKDFRRGGNGKDGCCWFCPHKAFCVR